MDGRQGECRVLYFLKIAFRPARLLSTEQQFVALRRQPVFTERVQTDASLREALNAGNSDGGRISAARPFVTGNNIVARKKKKREAREA